MHPSRGARQFVGDGLARRRRRHRIRHFEHGRHATKHRRAAAALEIFLVLVAGFAEVTLTVDDAGQNMQSPGVECFSRSARRKSSDRGNLAGTYRDVAKADPVRRRERAAADEQIERLRHAK